MLYFIMILIGFLGGFITCEIVEAKNYLESINNLTDILKRFVKEYDNKIERKFYEN